MKKTQVLIQLVAIVGLLLLAGQPRVVEAKITEHKSKTLEFGVFPYFPLRELEKIYAPIAADFSVQLGTNISFGSSSTFAKFREKADKQTFDIVFVQPFDYVRLADTYGYVPLASRGDKLEAVFVSKASSPLLSLQDLRDKKIALPPPVAAVSLLLKAYLQQQGFVDGKDVFFSHYKTHVSCMQQVLIGNADVCGTAQMAMQFFSKKMQVKMKVIAQTASIPHALFAAHPSVSEEQRKILIKTILSWKDTEAGRKLLGRGRFRPFVEISDKEYDVVREFSKNLNRQP